MQIDSLCAAPFIVQHINKLIMLLFLTNPISSAELFFTAFDPAQLVHLGSNCICLDIDAIGYDKVGPLPPFCCRHGQYAQIQIMSDWLRF